MSIVFDPTSALLGEMIHATALRHRVLATNLANVETPGYQAQEVTFAATLAELQGRGPQPTALPPEIRAIVEPDDEGAPRPDGNTVDLDRQMVKLAQNTQWHMAMIQILANRFAMMKAAMGNRG